MKEMPPTSQVMWIDSKSDVEIETIITDEQCF
jgi:hypothetical protein